MEKQPLGTEHHPRWFQGPPIVASVLMMKAWGKAHYNPPCMALLCFTECWQKVSTYVFVIWFLILARTVFHSTEEHCVVAMVIMETTHGKGSKKWGSFFGIVFPIEKIWNDLYLQCVCLTTLSSLSLAEDQLKWRVGFSVWYPCSGTHG